MTIDQLRTQTIADLGYNSWFSTKTYADLTPEQQITVTNTMEHYIQAHPDQFSSEQDSLANQFQASGGITDIQDYTLGDAASDFGQGAQDELTSINNAVNPFAEPNRQKLFITIMIVGVILVAIPILFVEHKASKLV